MSLGGRSSSLISFPEELEIFVLSNLEQVEENFLVLDQVPVQISLPSQLEK